MALLCIVLLNLPRITLGVPNGLNTLNCIVCVHRIVYFVLTAREDSTQLHTALYLWIMSCNNDRPIDLIVNLKLNNPLIAHTHKVFPARTYCSYRVFILFWVDLVNL